MTTERELKLTLRETEWRRLRDWATDTEALLGEVTQTNHYFDTPSLQLNAHKLMLRIREREGRWEMTFKQKLHRPELPGQHSLEVELPVAAETARALLEHPEPLAACDLPPAVQARNAAAQIGVTLTEVVVVGNLTTDRTTFRSPSGQFVLELDHSRYCGEEDYELECEAEDLLTAQRELQELFLRLNIPWTPSTLPKSARMVQRLRASSAPD